MKKSFLLLLGFGFLFISSCKYPTEYQVINTDNHFSLSVPPWMKKVDDLLPGAAFQYANHYRNFYAVVTTQEKSAAQKTFDELLTGNISIVRKAMNAPVTTDSASLNIANLPGTRVEVFGKMGDDNIYFSEVLLEGKNRYYHISVWTRGEDRKLRYKEDINKILASFKEL